MLSECLTTHRGSVEYDKDAPALASLSLISRGAEGRAPEPKPPRISRQTYKTPCIGRPYVGPRIPATTDDSNRDVLQNKETKALWRRVGSPPLSEHLSPRLVRSKCSSVLSLRTTRKRRPRIPIKPCIFKKGATSREVAL